MLPHVLKVALSAILSFVGHLGDPTVVVALWVILIVFLNGKIYFDLANVFLPQAKP